MGRWGMGPFPWRPKHVRGSETPLNPPTSTPEPSPLRISKFPLLHEACLESSSPAPTFERLTAHLQKHCQTLTRLSKLV